jgi:hypothetical protein
MLQGRLHPRREGQNPDRSVHRRLGKALPEPFGAFNTHYPITGVGEPSLLEIIR